MAYAANTSVSVSKTKGEIDALLRKHKATESVDSKIETFEDSFLSHIQMPDGSTVGQNVKPALAIAYRDNTMPPLLPAPRKD